MAGFDERYPARGTPPHPPGASGSGAWDDWDPSRARQGYTGHVPALRDLALAREAGLGISAPLRRPHTPGALGDLSAAGLALSVRAETADPLVVEYDQREPGFVELYDALFVPQWSAPFGRLLLSVFLTLPRFPGQQVLDVACGTGYLSLELARYLAQDCDLAGIDSWDEALVLARRRASDEWLRNVSFVAADIVESGLPESTFDTITCNLGMASFADRAGALGAMWRLARPGAQLLLTTPLQSALREFLDTYYLTLRDLKLGAYQQALEHDIARQPTVQSVRQVVERAGFEVRRVVTDSFVLRFPHPRAFMTSPLVQCNYLMRLRALVPDLTIRRLVFNEVERRLTARAQAQGGELAMTVPMLCVSAVRG